MNQEMREKVVQNLYDMAVVKWKAPVDFHEVSRSKSTGIPNTVYHKDMVYYGMPFTNQNRVSLPEFLLNVKDGVLKVPKDIESFSGTDCISPVLYAVDEFVKIPKDYFSVNFLQDRSITKPLGFFKNEENLMMENIKDKFSEQEFYESYSLLRAGDIICTSYPHSRMVTGSSFTVRENGMINPLKSYVILTENKSSLSDVTDLNNIGAFITQDDYAVPYVQNTNITDIREIKDMYCKKTHFRINRKVPFVFLYKMYNVPLTFNFYGD